MSAQFTESARITLADKGLPSRAAGLTIDEFIATGPTLDEFWTPLVVLYDDALRQNARVMAEWANAHGFALMPHGKTTMAPALWQRQLDAGAAGITLATPGQVRTARSLGFNSIMLANAVTDPLALDYLATELNDPGFSFTCWADSVETVDVMERALAATEMARPIDVCVDLGAAGGRTGARTVEAARAIAERVAASGRLRLAGVAGYEGSLGHDRSEAAMTAVRSYLGALVALHDSLSDLYDDGTVILTAGGSAYFDVVAEIVSVSMGSVPNTQYVLRSGAYLTHDEGFYLGISPLDAARVGPDAAGALRPAMRGMSRVVSRPEPELALLDGGKRDLPYDEGLPVPIGIAPDLTSVPVSLDGARVSALNDQHAYLRLPADSVAGPGDVVTLGLSHPCTTFDKWRYLPVVASSTDTRVIELVRTYF